MSYEIKVGDLDPPIPAFLLKQDETAVRDITGNPILFRFRLRDSGEAGFNVPQVATIVDGALASVSYRFVAGETDTAGEYEGEWILGDGSGNDRTFPSGQGIYHNFRINT